QERAGAAYIDLNASALLEGEVEALRWATRRGNKRVQVFTDSRAAVLTIQSRRMDQVKYVEVLWQIVY
ncbi:MAG: hypothetical protein K6T80_03505, partial [Firmicutes bacterium]|nr:hypothetical protein [Bacillota bacterium]